MTWTLENTIAWDGNDATNHTALVYLFDTYLPARGFVTAAHPDASAFKRKFQKTYTNTLAPGNATMYWWINWFSTTTTTSYTIYEDAIFTTTPGDLCTNTNNSLSSSFSTSSYPFYAADWKFWVSDQIPNASLVTRGKKVMFYDPGNTAIGYVDNGAWIAGDQKPSTHATPFITNGYSMSYNNAPFTSGSAVTTYAIVPGLTWGGSYNSGMNDTLYQNFPMIYCTSFSQIQSNSCYAFHINSSDVLLHYPGSSLINSSVDYSTTSSINGLLCEVNGRWYIRTNNTMNNISFMFDMGATEPDLT